MTKESRIDIASFRINKTVIEFDDEKVKSYLEPAKALIESIKELTHL